MRFGGLKAVCFGLRVCSLCLRGVVRVGWVLWHCSHDLDFFADLGTWRMGVSVGNMYFVWCP